MNQRLNTHSDCGSNANEFISLLPTIEHNARMSFRHRNFVDREDAIAETVAHVWVTWCRLSERGLNPMRFPASLIRFAILAVCNGRRVGGKTCSADVLDGNGRNRTFRAQPIEATNGLDDAWWRDDPIDFRVSVATQAAFHVDFPKWLQSLSPLNRRIAEQLAQGGTTSSVATANDITAGRVSQMRRELAASWDAFHGAE